MALSGFYKTFTFAEPHLFKKAENENAEPAERENLDCPAHQVHHGELGEEIPCRVAYFDGELNAWILSRYKDVLTVFYSDDLLSAGLRSTRLPEPEDTERRLAMRDEAIAALSRTQLDTWTEEMARSSDELLAQLTGKYRVDLLAKYANPLGARLAVLVTQPAPEAVPFLVEAADIVSAAAADPFDRVLEAKAKESERLMNRYFVSGPALLRGPGFVALSQTLPRLVARFWVALLRNPEQLSLLRANPSATPKAVEELFRYAGLTRVLCRVAKADVDLNGIHIKKGQRVLLRIDSANRDSSQFSTADALDLAATRSKHLALGVGAHSCVAAPLLRAAIRAWTVPLVERFPKARIDGEIRWLGGIGFQYPQSLPVLLDP
jgi:cytochrome P450